MQRATTLSSSFVLLLDSILCRRLLQKKQMLWVLLSSAAVDGTRQLQMQLQQQLMHRMGERRHLSLCFGHSHVAFISIPPSEEDPRRRLKPSRKEVLSLSAAFPTAAASSAAVADVILTETHRQAQASLAAAAVPCIVDFSCSHSFHRINNDRHP